MLKDWVFYASCITPYRCGVEGYVKLLIRGIENNIKCQGQNILRYEDFTHLRARTSTPFNRRIIETSDNSEPLERSKVPLVSIT
ncbi:CLUMA_CG006414, isoform A [Clunio marinus]|uniref:CLUMA_CG006414, isoform A n=1 Tax=Clunio marinus TaxID=568069 RepID=A0A1J1HZ57_9DIPT|nr:CLUMA_CG006414, isoform A [Clunio marinus]